MLNANLEFISTSTPDDNILTVVTLSMGVGAAMINPETHIQRTSTTPIHALVDGHEIYGNLSTMK